MLDPPITPGQMLRLTIAANAIQVPGAPSALAGLLIEELGYAAIYLSRRTLAAGMLGTCDECVLTLTELGQQVQYLTARVTVPVIVDAGNCAGDIANVRRAVVELERAGVAGIELGDGCHSGRNVHLIPRDEMLAKLRAAREVRVDDQLALIARTSARMTDGLDAAIARAQSYLAAGAEWIIPEGLASLEEFAAFAEAILNSASSPTARLAANMSEFGPTPLFTLEELAAVGYSIVLYPETLLRVSMKAMESTLSILAVDGTQRDVVDLMQTQGELEELVGED